MYLIMEINLMGLREYLFGISALSQCRLSPACGSVCQRSKSLIAALRRVSPSCSSPHLAHSDYQPFNLFPYNYVEIKKIT